MRSRGVSGVRLVVPSLVCAVSLAVAGTAAAQNRPPRLIVQTNPGASHNESPPLIEGPAPLNVFFSLCQSDDPDQILLPGGIQDPRGDTLNWQFHFGDSGTPAFHPDGSFNPDVDHICRVDHTYQEGTYIATVSGRGCRFVVPVILPRQADDAAPEQLPRHARRNNL